MTITADQFTTGLCHACAQPIDSRNGTRVDPEGNRYHPDCRTTPKPAPRTAKSTKASARR
jgi:hypothetical protein